MALRTRLRSVLLVAVLVAGLLVGFGDGDEAIAKEPRATIGKVMVSHLAFSPADNTVEYEHTNVQDQFGSGLELTGGISSETFSAPVWFPVPEVYIRRITLVAVDREGIESACVVLVRSRPLTTDSRGITFPACTTNTTDTPQRVTVNAHRAHRRLDTTVHQAVLELVMNRGPRVYGVQVVYSY